MLTLGGMSSTAVAKRKTKCRIDSLHNNDNFVEYICPSVKLHPFTYLGVGGFGQKWSKSLITSCENQLDVESHIIQIIVETVFVKFLNYLAGFYFWSIFSPPTHDVQHFPVI